MRPTKINGRWPIILPDHRADFHEARPWWEAARLSDMYDLLKPGDLIVDVGSEEGDLSALYGRWGCEVYCIDPSLPWLEQTADIFAANGLNPPDRWSGFAGPFTETEGRRRGIETPSFAQRTERPEIRVRTLDDLIGFDGCDAITIDVEGDELNVLAGASQTLIDHAPIVWVSIHGQFEVDPELPVPSDVHRWMRNLGFEDQFLAYDHEWHYRFWKP